MRVPEDSDSFAHLVKNMRKRTDPIRYRAMRKSFSLSPAPSLKELRKKLDNAKVSLSEVHTPLFVSFSTEMITW